MPHVDAGFANVKLPFVQRLSAARLVAVNPQYCLSLLSQASIFSSACQFPQFSRNFFGCQNEIYAACRLGTERHAAGCGRAVLSKTCSALGPDFLAALGAVGMITREDNADRTRAHSLGQ